MIDIEKIDNELYGAIYALPMVDNKRKIWNRIKKNSDILREAVEVRRNKWDNGDILKGITIADTMLRDANGCDPIAYIKLIDSIYSNVDIARIVLDGASNGGDSFLLMSLNNHNIILSDEQKEFAVKEAMNKLGTIKHKELNDNYFSYLLMSLSSTQAHGVGAYDIRYSIVRNSNWDINEKKKLVKDFWYSDVEYKNVLNEWEWDIINSLICFRDDIEVFDIDELYTYSYDDLLGIYNDKGFVDGIWSDISFCKMMQNLRPIKIDENNKFLILS